MISRKSRSIGWVMIALGVVLAALAVPSRRWLLAAAGGASTVAGVLHLIVYPRGSTTPARGKSSTSVPPVTFGVS